MEKRSRCGADHRSRSLARDHGGGSALAMGGSVRAETPTHQPERQSSESDRGGPGPEQDPYRDEGGEA
jgi:hypothetical protein